MERHGFGRFDRMERVTKGGEGAWKCIYWKGEEGRGVQYHWPKLDRQKADKKGGEEEEKEARQEEKKNMENQTRNRIWKKTCRGELWKKKKKEKKRNNEEELWKSDLANPGNVCVCGGGGCLQSGRLWCREFNFKRPTNFCNCSNTAWDSTPFNRTPFLLFISLKGKLKAKFTLSKKTSHS